MLKYLLCGAASLGLMVQMGAANASGVIINGVEHHGNTINVPYGHGVNCCQPQAVMYETAPAAYETAPITYEAAPVTYEATPVMTTYETVPATQGELIYLNDAPAIEPAVVYEQPAPVLAPVAAPVAYTQPVAASRGWGSRVYVGARGGWSAARDTDFSTLGLNVDNEYDQAGYNVAAVVGWGAKIQNSIGYRLEAELGYQSSEIDSHRAGGANTVGPRGDANTLYGFANAYLDVPLFAQLNGVVGGGLGLGKVEFEEFGTAGLGTLLDDDDTAFGYHLDAGLSYDVTDRFALEAMYRYTSFVDVEMTARDGTTSETDVDTHNVLVGARYGF